MTCKEKLLSPQNTAKGAITYEDGYLADHHLKRMVVTKNLSLLLNMSRVPVMKTENK